MKKAIIVLGLLLNIMVCHAASHKAKIVPQDITKSFSKQYPQVHVVKWIIENDSYIARFSSAKRKEEAYYLPNGNWVKTETKIPWSWDLPLNVDKAWKGSSFKTWNVNAIKEVSTPEHKRYFVIDVYKSCPVDEPLLAEDCQDQYSLFYDQNGKLFKKSHLTY